MILLCKNGDVFLRGIFSSLYEIYGLLLSLNFISLFALYSFQLLNTSPIIANICKGFRKTHMCPWYEANNLPDLLSAMQGNFNEVYKLHKSLKEVLMWGTRIGRRKWKVKNGCVVRLEAGLIMKTISYHLIEEKIRRRTG